MLHSCAARVVMAIALTTTVMAGGFVLPASAEEPILPLPDPATAGPATEADVLDDPDRAEAFDEVTDAAGTGTVRALVALDVPVDPAGVAADLDAPSAAIDDATDVIADVVADTGGEVVRRYDTLPYVSIEVPAETVAELSEVPEAVMIDEVELVATPQLSNSLPAIEAPDAWNVGAEGDGTMIAVIDSGLDTSSATPHPTLAARVTHEACFTNGQCPGATDSADGPESSAPCDNHVTCGHGTGVTAIAAAVAPDAEVLSIRAGTRTYCSGWGCLFLINGVTFFHDDMLAAMDHVATFASENPLAPPIAAVNMSIGGLISAEELDDPDACDSHPLEPALAAMKDAVDVLAAQGIASVIAAGNNGISDQVTWPACVTGAVAVGATDVHNVDIAAYSNSSPKIDILAPGGEGSGCASVDGLVVPWDDGTITSCSGAGTSFAAPHVAGAFAVLRRLIDDAGVPPSVAVPVIKHLITSTGAPITDSRNSLVRPALLLGPAVEAVDELPDPADLEGIGGYQPVAATRVVDTTNGTGTCDAVPCDRLLADTAVRATVAGVGPIPASGVTAVLVRLSAIDPAGPGGVALSWNPEIGFTDSLLYTGAAEDDTVTGIARVGDDGAVGVSAVFVDSDVQIDVLGYFGDDPLVADLGYLPVGPDLLADTDDGAGDCLPSPCARLAALDPVDVAVPLDLGVGAAMLDVSATGASGPGTLEITDSGGVVATLAVDSGKDMADLVPVDGDVTIVSSVAVDVTVSRIGDFGADGGRLAFGAPAIAMSGSLLDGVPVQLTVPVVPDSPSCVSAAVLLVVAQAVDPGALVIGADGDAAQFTMHLGAGGGRSQLLLAAPDENGEVTMEASTDMDVTMLRVGWLACAEAQWASVFA